MERNTKSKQLRDPHQRWKAQRALVACGYVVIGLSVGGAMPALADEEAVERSDRLIFTYEIYNDGTVDAAWGAGTNPRTIPQEELVPVQVLVPPDIAARLHK